MIADSTFLVLARLAGFIGFSPFWGQTEIPTPIKMLTIIGLTFIIEPLTPVKPTDSWTLHTIVPLLVIEVLVGFFFGAVTRMLVSILDILGNIISFQMGLSFATTLNPMLQTHTTLISVLLTQAGIIILLSHHMHYLFLHGIIQSYQLTLSIESGSWTIVRAISLVFSSAFQLATPFLVLNFFVQATVGLLNRFVPNLQFFAISLPLQAWAGIVVLAITIMSLLSGWYKIVETIWQKLFES